MQTNNPSVGVGGGDRPVRSRLDFIIGIYKSPPCCAGYREQRRETKDKRERERETRGRHVGGIASSRRIFRLFGIQPVHKIDYAMPPCSFCIMPGER